MKNKLLLGVALFGAAAGVSSPALAAPPPPPIPYNWTGCYIGANAGYSWGRGNVDVNALSLGFPFGASMDMNGFIGGGQIGCNWQVSNAVWGLETDFQGSAQKGSRAAAFNFSEGSSSHNVEAKLRWFGTVRARAGVLVVPTVLLYGTGGLAYGNVQVTDTIFSNSFGTATFSNSDTRVGWTVGFGVEGLFFNAPQWTWRVEYLYMDLGTSSGSAIDPSGLPVVWSTRVTDNIVRAAINFRFGP
jgi:outer membrane immunogenic protein